MNNRLLLTLETLQMPIQEVSAKLSRLVNAVESVSLTLHSDEVLASREIDVVVTGSGFDRKILVAEPLCGYLQPDALAGEWNTEIDELRFFTEAIRRRRETILDVLRAVCELSHGFPYHQNTLKMATIAEKCNQHISVVSHALNNKICQSEAGSVPFELC
jgi:hypothetical protein